MIPGWRRITAIGLPIALLPLLLCVGTKEAKCGYVTILMGFYWLLELAPIPITAFFPIIFYPLLGIISTKEVAAVYMSEYNMMFLASVMAAVAFEHSNLHRRIAIKTLLFVGTSPKRLTLGFLLATMGLSMWIFNSATAAMMIPIVEAIVGEMYGKNKKPAIPELTTVTINGDYPQRKISTLSFENNVITRTEEKTFTFQEKEKEQRIKEIRQEQKEFERLHKALLLSIAYGASCGGTGTLIGTGPNLIMKGILEELFPGSKEVTFATWMMYGVPGMILCGFASWLCLIASHLRNFKSDKSGTKSEQAKIILQKKYEELGRLSFHEAAVLFLFVLMIGFCFFRDPQIIPGWLDVIHSDVKISNATPALLTLMLMFIVPSHPRKFLKSKPLLEWKILNDRVPWGVAIFFGGALAMGEGIKKSGLSIWLGHHLLVLQPLSPPVIVALLCTITAFLTEFTSNGSVASVFLPIAGQLDLNGGREVYFYAFYKAISLGLSPLYLMLPIAQAVSYSFMLPVANAPNALIFEAGNMKVMDMVKPGIFANILCIGINIGLIHSLGKLIFTLDTFPDWANNTLTQEVTTVLPIGANATMLL